MTMTAAPPGPGFIIVRGGKIESIARTLPRGAQRALTLKARTVTPGLIDARTVLGLAGLIRQDDDRDETERAEHRAPAGDRCLQPARAAAAVGAAERRHDGAGRTRSRKLDRRAGRHLSHGRRQHGGSHAALPVFGGLLAHRGCEDHVCESQPPEYANGERRVDSAGVHRRRAGTAGKSRRRNRRIGISRASRSAPCWRVVCRRS